jgi:hypothetical protein
MKITSQQQAKFFGAVASGRAKKAGLKPAKARKMLRENKGFRMRNLPARTPKRTNSRAPKR